MDYKKIIAKIQTKREKSFTKLTDIKRIENAMLSGNWSPVHKSTLYKLHSGEYCELLQVMNVFN